MTRFRLLIALTLLLLLVSGAAAQQYDIKWLAVSSGGNTAASSSNYKVGLTTALTAAGSAESPNFRAHLGFWYPHIGLSLLVQEDTDPTLPTGFNLSQNYPNPFNPRTTISFSLGSSEWVRLVVYNSLGQRVAQLVDQPLPAGSYRAEWNGCDLTGVPVASGIYLYRLEAGDYFDSRKMLLLK